MSTRFVATAPIFIGRSRAHNIGDEVPEDNVRNHGWEAYVEEVGEERVAELQAELTGDYDPSSHTVEEVQAYLADADPAEQERVRQAEREGKARQGIVG